MNIISGQAADRETAVAFLDKLGHATAETLQKEPLSPELVITAADALSNQLASPEALGLLTGLGLDEERARAMLAEAAEFLSRGYLETKMERELGNAPFEYRRVGGRAQEKFAPLGVLTHISAGNASGLPAFSVLEGLLAGNINLLKLPGGEDGLSTSILLKLIELEPRLAEYVYAFDLPSTDAESIQKMLAVSDAVAVWGSDFAVSGIRSLAPPNIQLIEWGHRLSFNYITQAGETPEALEGAARDICLTEQLLCSSPQCVYYETDSFAALTAFARRFAAVLASVSQSIPTEIPDRGSQADITSQLLLSSREEMLEEKKVLRGEGWSVTADMNPVLRPSPMYRNIWVKPLPKEKLFDVLRPSKGYLQTVGLACSAEEADSLSVALCRCGVCRVTPCGMMSSNYSGEPHDGQPALRRYVKTIVRML